MYKIAPVQTTRFPRPLLGAFHGPHHRPFKLRPNLNHARAARPLPRPQVYMGSWGVMDNTATEAEWIAVRARAVRR